MVLGSTNLMSTATCRLLLRAAARRLRILRRRTSSIGKSAWVSTCSSTWSVRPFMVRMIWYWVAISGNSVMTCDLGREHVQYAADDKHAVGAAQKTPDLAMVRPHAHCSGMMRVTSRVR